MSPKARPAAVDAATGRMSEAVAGSSVTSIGRRTHGLPVGEASAYAPCGQRSLWVFSVSCPHCGGRHLHRGTGPDVLDGKVRAGCGRRYLIRVRRRYFAREAAA